MKEQIRPLTKIMFSQLQLAHEKELSEKGDKIVTPSHFKGTLAGLYKRGIVNTRKIIHEGKYVESVYITFAGIRYLERREQKLAR